MHFTHLVWHRGLCYHRDLPGTSLLLSVISGTEKKEGLCFPVWIVVGQFPVIFQFTVVVSKVCNVYFI